MDAGQIKKQIEDEINGNWQITNLHGVDLKQSLVEPRKVICNWDSGEEVEMWLVLEERPIEKNGYKIVYDEEAGSYCLALIEADEYRVWCYYGSFLETLKDM